MSPRKQLLGKHEEDHELKIKVKQILNHLTETGLNYHSQTTGQCGSFETAYQGFQAHP